MEFQGTVYKIMPEMKGTSARGEWQRQDVIFEMMDGQYARKVAVTFFNKPTEVAGLVLGASYNVSFNVESREYNERWYTDVRAWRVMPVEAGAVSAMPQDAQQMGGQMGSQMGGQIPAQQATMQQNVATPPAAPQTADDVDDLPF